MSATEIRHVTEEQSDAWWCGKLSMAVAIAPRHPQTARETLEEFLHSPLATTKLSRLLREEMRKK